uniref:BTB/POZ domain-containing protein At3q05675-like protein n=1 Tax=Tradescantia hirsutiflora TaxID=428262 RepID=A0A1B1X413_9LILI|nr:BTB/POZ domain-containing protein At3q05675-like protein [Tradescantia hirsutiflora]
MEQHCSTETCSFGDQLTSDVIVCLNKDRMPERFHLHSAILRKQSNYFAKWFSENLTFTSESNCCIDVNCPVSEYEHYIKLLKLLYLSEEFVSDLLDSVKSAIGVLQASVALECGEVARICIQYLESVSWDENEEEKIIELAPRLGPEAAPLLARIHPADTSATKNVFLSAIRFATTVTTSCPPFADELKISAQEQVEYMLLEDDDSALITVDDDVMSEVKICLAKMFTSLEIAMKELPSRFDQSPETAEQKVLNCLADLEWITNVLPKMEMMQDFVSIWNQISSHILSVACEEKYSSSLWAIKLKLIELTGKALDAVGYGTVVLPASTRVQFLNTWLPYIRTMKPILDSKSLDDEAFPYKMDSDLCQNIEGAITSLLSALPSNDQADILAEWIKMTEQLKYPDLTEAFEVWCYRTKAAKRRILILKIFKATVLLIDQSSKLARRL